MTEYSISDRVSKEETRNSPNAHRNEMCCTGLWNHRTDRYRVCHVLILKRKGNQLNSKMTVVWLH